VITKQQRRNSERIVALSDTFGRLYINDFGQSTNSVLNLSIPCAHLVVAGVVTGVDPDTFDGVNDQAVADVEASCAKGIEHAINCEPIPWQHAYKLVELADSLGLELPPSLNYIALECRSGRGRQAA